MIKYCYFESVKISFLLNRLLQFLYLYFFRYNGLILAHAKRNEPIEAEKVIREMKERGIQPDVV